MKKYKLTCNVNGVEKPVIISEQDSMNACINDYKSLLRTYNPKYVEIQRLKAGDGEWMHLKITVHAKSHYLCSSTDKNPKPCNQMSVYIIVYKGYPLKRIKAYYASERYLASPNVFTNGGACIDTWLPLKSNLLTVADKVVNDMIHNPFVTKYDSPANTAVIDWHKKGVKSGAFPTIKPTLLYRSEEVALPVQRKRSQGGK